MSARTTTTVYFKNPAGQLLEDSAGFLRAQWSAQERDLAILRAFFQHMTHALRRNKWSKVLIDQTNMRPFSAEEQQWVAHEWLPQAVLEGGYRFGAVLVSENVFVRLATAYVTTSVQNLPLTYRSFTDEDSAVAWLLAQ